MSGISAQIAMPFLALFLLSFYFYYYQSSSPTLFIRHALTPTPSSNIPDSSPPFPSSLPSSLLKYAASTIYIEPGDLRDSNE